MDPKKESDLQELSVEDAKNVGGGGGVSDYVTKVNSSVTLNGGPNPDDPDVPGPLPGN